ncbi:MAG: hypothetical protein HYR56_06505 [Acidobacteria bacterium]|nr:hypothetical protein [Acidobacteriota bacterium]
MLSSTKTWSISRSLNARALIALALLTLTSWAALPQLTRSLASLAAPLAGQAGNNYPSRKSGRAADAQNVIRDRPSLLMTQLPTDYSGPASLVSALKQNAGEPLALAAGDFDEDGVPDVISGYANAGGLVTL